MSSEHNSVPGCDGRTDRRQDKIVTSNTRYKSYHYMLLHE